MDYLIGAAAANLDAVYLLELACSTTCSNSLTTKMARSNTMKTTILNHLKSVLTSVKEVFAHPDLPKEATFPSYEIIWDERAQQATTKAERAAALLKTKQAVARAKLGAKHIHHPHYRFDPRHSNDTAIYPHFRTPYLNEVRDAAEVARSDNPAHLRHIANLYHLTQGAR